MCVSTCTCIMVGNFRKAVLPLEQELMSDADTESDKSLDEDTDGYGCLRETNEGLEEQSLQEGTQEY